VDDLFTEPGARLPTTFAVQPRKPEAVARWARPTPLRMSVTVLLFAGGAWLNSLGWAAILGFPVAAIACQCVRRWNALRWSLWSILGAAFGAQMFILGGFPVRFAACLLLVGPFVFYAGSQLRDV
jgi:hypothetical protein